MPTDFRNEPFTDFSKDENRRAMAQAIAAVAESLGESHPMLIDGEKIRLPLTFDSINPSDPSVVVGTFPNAGSEQAEQALVAANRAFESWKTVPVATRAEVLFKTAAAIRERKFEFAAWMCFEAGKNWAEADGDVAEAIDFLEFYGREALRYADARPLTPLAGEENRLAYIPLGAGVVIPPWNFPLAIVVGMSSAAIVAGNTLVLKPAPATPTVAWKYVETIMDAGLPAGVLNFLTHDIPMTESVGNRLVAHPKTRFVSFTGSKQVGLHINALAAQSQPGQKWIKRVVAEMGGKDAIVVDRGADPDAAAQGIVASAFGFSGQKCSACSRAILHEDVYDGIVKRILERTRQLRVGPGIDFETDVGPVIDTRAVKKILDYIEIGKQEGKLVLGGNGPAEGQGYFIEPTVFVDVPNGARISKEEIFGPVLAITKARDFEEAIGFANDTEYGLTGAVYSPDEANLEKAVARFHVGNLYLNRKCTGALVGVHPFGGFNMSGTDSKAGGSDYLLLFLQAKSISRKV